MGKIKKSSIFTYIWIVLIVGITPLYAHGVAVFTADSIRVIGLVFAGFLFLFSLLFQKVKIVQYLIQGFAAFLIISLYAEPVISRISKNLKEYHYQDKKEFFKKSFVTYDKESEKYKDDTKKSLILLKKFKHKLLRKGILVKNDDYVDDIFYEEKYHNRYKNLVAKKMLYLTILGDKSLIGNREIDELKDSDYNDFYKKYRVKFTSEKIYINFLKQYHHYAKYLREYKITHDMGKAFVKRFYENKYKKSFQLLLPLLPSSVLLKKDTLDTVLMFDKEKKSHSLTNMYLKTLEYSYSATECDLYVVETLYLNLQTHSNPDYVLDIAFKELKKECSSKKIELYISENKRECDLYLYSKKRAEWMEVYFKSKNFKKIEKMCK